MTETPTITLAKLKAELLRQVRVGQIGKWRAFSEFVIMAPDYLPNKYQHANLATHIRWAGSQMDDLERCL